MILVEGDSDQVSFGNLCQALAMPDTQLCLFGKPEVKGLRRMGVALALGTGIDEAIGKAKAVSSAVEAEL